MLEDEAVLNEDAANSEGNTNGTPKDVVLNEDVTGTSSTADQ